MSNSSTLFTRVVLATALILCNALELQAHVRAQDPVQTPPAPVEARPALLGVRLEKSESWGVLAESVTEGSAADKAGLVAGDLILGIGGRVTESVDGARTILREHWAGDRVQLVFRRGDRIQVAECVLGARSESLESAHNRSAALEEVLAFLKVQPGQQVADIGFGNGWLTLGLAKATGPKGRVYAVEINSGDVERMRRRKIPNITVVHSKRDDVLLEGGCIDLAVLCDVASHVEESARPSFYASLAGALRMDGRLAVFSPHGEAKKRIEELAGFGFHPQSPKALVGLSEEELDERIRLGIDFVYHPEPPEDGR